MSSGLKEKLKKLGRYRGSSGSPIINQPISASIANDSVINNCASSHEQASNAVISERKISTLLTGQLSSSQLAAQNNETMAISSVSLNPLAISNTTKAKASFVFNENAFALEETVIVWKEKERQLQETLRKLNLVKLYESKNNLVELEVLITNWRDACQKALNDLLNKYPEPKPSMAELLDFLKIDKKTAKYDPEEDAFA